MAKNKKGFRPSGLAWRRIIAMVMFVLILSQSFLPYSTFASQDMDTGSIAPLGGGEQDADLGDADKPTSKASMLNAVEGFTVRVLWNDNKAKNDRPEPVVSVTGASPLTEADNSNDIYSDYVFGGFTPSDGYSVNISSHDGYRITKSSWNESEGVYVIQLTKLMTMKIPLNYKDADNIYSTRPSIDASAFTLLQYAKASADGSTPSGVVIDVGSDKISVDLDMYDADGEPYRYSIAVKDSDDGIDVESGNTLSSCTNIPKYTVTYENKGNFADKTDAAYVNTLGDKGEIALTLTGDTEFKGDKVWLDYDNDTDAETETKNARPTGTLQLYRYANNGSNNFAQGSPVPGMTLPLEGALRHTAAAGIAVPIDYSSLLGESKALPRFDEDGFEYIYFVKEFLDASGYEKLLENNGNLAGSDKYLFNGGTIKNRRVGTVSVSAQKIWKAAANQGLDKSIEFSAQKKISENEWEPIGDSQKLDFKAELQDKSASFSMPKYDDKGKPIEYRVIEGAVEIDGKPTNPVYDGDNIIGFKTANSNGDWYESKAVTDENGNVTITNTLRGNINLVIKKIWDGDKPDPVPELSFTITGGDSSQIVTLPSDKTEVSLVLPKYNENGELYEYTVTETNVPDGYSARYSYSYDSKPDSDELDTLTATVTNKQNSGEDDDGKYSGIKVEKKWLDNGDESSRRPVIVGLFNVSDGTAAKDKDGNPITATISRNSGFDEYWVAYVPIPEDGNAENYYVKEIGADVTGEGTTFEYTDSSGDNHNLTQGDVVYPDQNATPVDQTGLLLTDKHVYKVTTSGSDTSYTITNLRVGTVDIAVDKKWVDGDTKNEYRPNIKVELYRGNEKQNTVELDRSTWETSFLNLPKYNASGKLYSYTVKEVFVDELARGDYKDSQGLSYKIGEWRTDDTANYTLTNTLSDSINNPQITKLWLDDGKTRRPDIYLEVYSQHADPGTPSGRSAPVLLGRVAAPFAPMSADKTKSDFIEHRWDTAKSDRWVCTFLQNFPKYTSGGYEITYYVREVLPVPGDYKGYYNDTAPTIDAGGDVTNLDALISGMQSEKNNFVKLGGTIINRPEKIRDLKGVKAWKNLPSVSKMVYPEIEVSLYYVPIEGTPVLYEQDDLTNPMKIADGKTSFEFKNIPKYDKYGKVITYSISETPVDGYDNPTVNYSPEIGYFTLKNTYTGGGTRNISIEKSFADTPVPPGTMFAPQEITVKLYRQMQNSSKTLIPDTQQFVQDIKLTISYDAGASKYVSSHDPVNNLPIYAPNGEKWVYLVKEEIDGGYTIAYTDGSGTPLTDEDGKYVVSDGGSVKIANKYKVSEVIPISGTKTWDDSSNKYDTRPEAEDVLDKLSLWRIAGGDVWESVPATFSWNGATTGDSWAYTVTAGTKPFNKYAPSGKLYTYQVQEAVVPGYNNGYNNGNTKSQNVNTSGIADITNTLDTVNFTLTKTWLDENNIYQTRPANDEITLQLQYDNAGSFTAFPNAPTASKTGSGKPSYTYTWSGLPKYKPGTSDLYSYSAVETHIGGIAVDNNTAYNYTVEHGAVNNNKQTITNTVMKKEEANISITVIKDWQDNDNQDGERPTSLDIELYRNGSKIHTVTLNSTNNWQHTFKNLPKYIPNTTTEAIYMVKEVTSGLAAKGYTAVEPVESPANTYTFTNSYTPKTFGIEATKSWMGDTAYINEVRPGSVTLALQVNNDGAWETAKDQDGITAENKNVSLSNGWKAEWTNLPQRKNGANLQYRVVEVDTLNGYTSSPATITVEPDTATGATLTGTVANTMKTTSITVNKVWSGPEHTVFPNNVTIQLYQNGFEFGGSIQLIASNSWTHSFTNLPTHDKSGNTYAYTVKETHIGDVELNSEGWADGYSMTQSTSGTNVTITNTRENTSYEVEKQWIGGYNDKVDSVTVKLQRKNQGGEWQDTSYTYALTKANAWKHDFTDLPKYDVNGNLYEYRGIEVKLTTSSGDTVAVPDSGTVLTGKIGAWRYAADVQENKTVLTNTLEAVSLSGSKTWEDDSNYYGERPSDITLTVKAGAIVLSPQPEIVWGSKAGNVWSYSASGLPRYNANGDIITYSVAETPVIGYTASSAAVSGSADSETGNITDADFINTLDTFSISGTKKWDDDSDKYGLRPEALGLTVYDTDISGAQPMNPQPKPSQIQWAKNGNTWSYVISGLPKPQSKSDAEKYRIEEDEVYAYSATSRTASGKVADSTYNITEADFTNKLQTGTLTVEKNTIMDGSNVEDNFSFKFKVEYQAFDGSWKLFNGSYTHKDKTGASTSASTDEDGNIILKGGQSISIESFAVGDFPAVKYRVLEEPHVNFSPSGDVGKTAVQQVTNNNETIAKITNTWKTKLQITNITPDPVQENQSGGIGGKVRITTVAGSETDGCTDYKDDQFAVAWKPDDYYIFNDRFEIKYICKNSNDHTITVDGFIGEDGKPKPSTDSVYDQLRDAYPNFQIGMSQNGEIVLTLGSGKSEMQPVNAVEVGFSPTLAVENTTDGDLGGIVQVYGGQPNTSSDGNPHKDGSSRYPQTAVYGEARTGYHVDVDHLTIGNPHTSSDNVGNNVNAVPIKPDADGYFTAEVPLANRSDTLVTVRGQVLYDTPFTILRSEAQNGMISMVAAASSVRGSVTSVTIKLDSLPIPLDIGIPFVPAPVISGESPNPKEQKEKDFWDEVEDTLKIIKENDTLTVYPGEYDKIPNNVIEELRKKPGAVLIIVPDNGDPIVIPASKLPPAESGRVYYPLSYLMEFFRGIQQPKKPVQPVTGGVLVNNPDTGSFWELRVPGSASERISPAAPSHAAPAEPAQQPFSPRLWWSAAAAVATGTALLTGSLLFMNRRRQKRYKIKK